MDYKEFIACYESRVARACFAILMPPHAMKLARLQQISDTSGCDICQAISFWVSRRGLLWLREIPG